jgi:ribosomal-protein-alanine N-acetyltransferase
MHSKKIFSDLIGNRVDLVGLNSKYLRDMHEYSTQPAMFQFFEFDHHNSFEQTASYFDRLTDRSNETDAKWWFIKLKETNKAIGTVGVHDINWLRLSGEISYGISPNYWKKGFFVESAEILINFLQVKLKLRRITAKTSVLNEPSVKALKKLGFAEEGRFKDFYRNSDGQYTDALTFALVCPNNG